MRMGTADLRSTVLDARIELIEEEGLAALSMREVARRAGVSHQAPYHHFGDREGILAALAADGFTQLHNDMQKAIASTKSRSKRIEAVGNAYIEFALKYPGYFKIMFRSELVDLDRFDDVRKIADETFALVTSVVEPFSIRAIARKGRDSPGANVAGPVTSSAVTLTSSGAVGGSPHPADGETSASNNSPIVLGAIRMIDLPDRSGARAGSKGQRAKAACPRPSRICRRVSGSSPAAAPRCGDSRSIGSVSFPIRSRRAACRSEATAW